MSNIQLFESGNVVPAYLKKLPIDAVTKALMGGTSGKRISIRGSVFRMMVGGEEVSKSESRAMNIIIVNANEGISRVYYEGKYVEGEHMAPTCASDDGKTPREDSKKKQSDKCVTCPMNIKGSGNQGGRACGFSQRLAVVLENDPEGNVFQLNLPSQSIFGKAENGKMPLQAYVKLLASHGLPVTAVVTEMKFDTDSSTPKLTFRAIRPLSEKELATAQAQGESEDALAAISATPAQFDGTVTKTNEALFEDNSQPVEGTPPEEPAPTKRAAKKKETPEVDEQPVVDSDVKSILEELDDWDDA